MALLYNFTPLYKEGSKVVVKAQHLTTLKHGKVVVKVLKVVRKKQVIVNGQ